LWRDGYNKQGSQYFFHDHVIDSGTSHFLFSAKSFIVT